MVCQKKESITAAQNLLVSRVEKSHRLSMSGCDWQGQPLTAITVVGAFLALRVHKASTSSILTEFHCTCMESYIITHTVKV